MVKREEKSIKKKFIVFAIIFLVITFFVTAFFGDKGIIYVIKYNKEIENLEKEIKLLEKKKRRLEIEIELLENEKYAVEPIARKELGYIKEGEKLLIIKEKKK